MTVKKFLTMENSWKSQNLCANFGEITNFTKIFSWNFVKLSFNTSFCVNFQKEGVKCIFIFTWAPELFHWIFDYLDTQTILDSIRPVCTQLDAIVSTYNKLRLDFSSSNLSNLRSIAKFIQPENVISLILADKNAIESSRVTLFFSLFQLDQFTRLQSLTLVEINGTVLDQLFLHITARSLSLRLLSIQLCRQRPAETERIINLLSTTIEQSGLQNLHLNIFDSKLIINNILQPIQNALRHLTVRSCEYLISCYSLSMYSFANACTRKLWI
jgi:hypothetical protein